MHDIHFSRSQACCAEGLEGPFATSPGGLKLFLRGKIGGTQYTSQTQSDLMASLRVIAASPGIDSWLSACSKTGRQEAERGGRHAAQRFQCGNYTALRCRSFLRPHRVSFFLPAPPPLSSVARRWSQTQSQRGCVKQMYWRICDPDIGLATKSRKSKDVGSELMFRRCALNLVSRQVKKFKEKRKKKKKRNRDD